MLRLSSSLFRYSFSVPPKLDLHVRPKLGEREVTLCHVTEWIEKKLQDEFQVKENMKNPCWILLPVLLSFLLSPFLTFFSRKSLSCRTWMTFIYPWWTQGWTVLKQGSISRHSSRALEAPPETPSRELQQSRTSAKLTEADLKHRRQRRRWRRCASKVKQSLMFTCRTIHMRLYKHFFAV